MVRSNDQSICRRVGNGVLEEGEAGRTVLPLGDHASKFRRGAKAIAQQVGLRGSDGVWLAFINGERVDEFQNQRSISSGGRTAARSCFRTARSR